MEKVESRFDLQKFNFGVDLESGSTSEGLDWLKAGRLPCSLQTLPGRKMEGQSSRAAPAGHSNSDCMPEPPPTTTTSSQARGKSHGSNQTHDLSCCILSGTIFLNTDFCIDPRILHSQPRNASMIWFDEPNGPLSLCLRFVTKGRIRLLTTAEYFMHT